MFLIFDIGWAMWSMPLWKLCGNFLDFLVRRVNTLGMRGISILCVQVIHLMSLLLICLGLSLWHIATIVSTVSSSIVVTILSPGSWCWGSWSWAIFVALIRLFIRMKMVSISAHTILTVWVFPLKVFWVQHCSFFDLLCSFFFLLALVILLYSPLHTSALWQSSKNSLSLRMSVSTTLNFSVYLMQWGLGWARITCSQSSASLGNSICLRRCLFLT